MAEYAKLVKMDCSKTEHVLVVHTQQALITPITPKWNTYQDLITPVTLTNGIQRFIEI